jgi:hypothetical protein
MFFDLVYARFGEKYAMSGSIDPEFTGKREETVVGYSISPPRVQQSGP